jgi:hypothetical protein
MNTLSKTAKRKIVETVRDGIKKNGIYMFVFIGFGIGFLIIFSLLLALTNQAQACVSDKDIIDTGFIFGSIGLVISTIIIIFALVNSNNMKTLLEYLTKLN